MNGVAPLIKDVLFGALLAEKAFDANWLLEELSEGGAIAVIPPKSIRVVQREYDEEVCCWRHPVENHFAQIKEFGVIATRYDKTDGNYAANWNAFTVLIASR